MLRTFGRRSALRRVTVVASAAILALGVAACSGSSDANGSKTGDLKVVVPVQAPLLDPTQGSVQAIGVLMLGLEPLQRIQPDGTLGPDLATELTQPDPRTYVYKIRSGVKFWDGTPLTTGDVVYSFNLHAAEGSESVNASLWSSVASITATGDEVTVKLAEPDPQFPYVVAQTGIVSKSFYEAHPGEVGTPGVMNMGTGPYEFESFKPSAETVLKANPDYWGDKPAYDEITARTVGDDSTRLLALQSGEFDGILNVPLNQLSSYAGIDGYRQAGAPDYSVYKFNFDTSKAPWNDIHLRRAVAMAIDRADLVKGALGDTATLAPTLVPSDVMKTLVPADDVTAAYEDLEADLPAFDLDAAKQEMAKSSVPDGVSVTLPVTGSDPNLSAIAQTAAQTLSQIGVEVSVQEVDDNTYYNAVYFKHTTDGFTLDNFGASSPDPANIPLYGLLSTNALPDGSGVNIAQYSNPRVDQLLHSSQALGTEDPKRGELLLEALKTSQTDLPYVPIAFPNVYAVADSKLDLSHFTTFWWLTDWARPAA